MNHIYHRLILCLAIFTLLFSSCEKEPDKVVHIDKDEFTTEDQFQIGQNLSALIAASSNEYTQLSKSENSEFYTYINRLLETVVNTSMVENRNVYPWEIIILHNDDIRSAFTIPGGKIYIYTGLLKMIHSENELFSLLAHEAYYAEKEDLVETMKDEYGTIIVGDLVLGTQSQGAMDIVESIQHMSIPKAKVENADRFTIELICPFQYDANGLKSLIERAMNNSEDVRWLSTRPGFEDRLEQLEGLATNCGEEEHTFVERYESYKSLLP